MNTISLDEIREALAMGCVEGIYKDRELMEIYMNGFTGYNNESDDDVVDWYTNMFLPEMDIDDKEPVEVLAITGQDDSKVLYKVVQHNNCCDIVKV